MVTVDGDRAEFSFFRPNAHSVHLIGEFNGWQEGNLSMICDRGYWRGELRLPAGDYRFQYVADGQHFVDYAAFGIEPGPFGFNSVVRIAPLNREPTTPILRNVATRNGEPRRRNMSADTRSDCENTDFSDTLSVVRQQRTETKRKKSKDYRAA